MRSTPFWLFVVTLGLLSVFIPVLARMAVAAQDKYTLKVPGGLAFSEFRGYEGWQAVAISQSGRLAVISR
jgi:hypothetical protein